MTWVRLVNQEYISIREVVKDLDIPYKPQIYDIKAIGYIQFL